jgi:hypothetical protein
MGVKVRTLTKKRLNVWPVYIKNPGKDLSSFALNSILLYLLNKTKNKFKITQIDDITKYSYCPMTKIYLSHTSYNSGKETHFFYHDGRVLGSIVINIASDQISNWKSEALHSYVIEFLKCSLDPLVVAKNENSYLFNDNYSLQAGFSLSMEIDGEDLTPFIVDVYLDLSHDVGKIISKL